MTTYAIFELRCPVCEVQYAQMIPENEEHLPSLCPSCKGRLERLRKLSGKDLLTCGFDSGGG